MKVSLFLFRNWRQIIVKFRALDIKISKVELLYVTFKQLVSVTSWGKYFDANKYQLVVVDFDRDLNNSPIVLSAKRNGIKTVTLVHGVLNPPFAYIPIIADEIWCWGNYQKEQLLSYSVSCEKIKVVGNPIAKSILNTYKKNKLITIGVGLNPWPKDTNDSFFRDILSSSEFESVNWLIKLHPAMKKKYWEDEYTRKNVKVLDYSEVTNESFFQQIDLLIVGNSGLGFEAVISNVPIWVYRVSQGRSGNDGVMIEDGAAPNIRDYNVINKEMSKLLNNKDYLLGLLNTEKRFVENEFYSEVGEEASKKIINEIKKILNL